MWKSPEEVRSKLLRALLQQQIVKTGEMLSARKASRYSTPKGLLGAGHVCFLYQHILEFQIPRRKAGMQH